MKNQIPTPALIAACVGVAVVLILIGWKVFSSGGESMDSKTISEHIAAKNAKNQ